MRKYYYMEENKAALFGKLSKMKFFWILALVFGIVCAGLEALVLIFGFDSKMGVFEAGNPLGNIALIVISIGTIVSLVPIAMIGKGNGHGCLPPCNTPQTLFAAMSGGLLFTFSFIKILTHIIDASKSSAGISLKTLFKGAPNSIKLFMLIASIPAAAYLILSAVSKKSSGTKLTVLGFFPVIWSAFCLLMIYFDRTTAINNPTKILAQLALAAIMLFFLTELRIRVEKPHLGLYFAAGCAAFVLGFSYSVSMIIGDIAGITGLASDMLLCITVLFSSLYALARVMALEKTANKE